MSEYIVCDLQLSDAQFDALLCIACAAIAVIAGISVAHLAEFSLRRNVFAVFLTFRILFAALCNARRIFGRFFSSATVWE